MCSCVACGLSRHLVYWEHKDRFFWAQLQVCCSDTQSQLLVYHQIIIYPLWVLPLAILHVTILPMDYGRELEGWRMICWRGVKGWVMLQMLHLTILCFLIQVQYYLCRSWLFRDFIFCCFLLYVVIIFLLPSKWSISFYSLCSSLPCQSQRR